MASTPAAEPSSAMEETEHWRKLSPDFFGVILHKLGAVEILIKAWKVCPGWSRICTNQEMWNVIDLHEPDVALAKKYDIKKLVKEAVRRSCGELIDINIDSFGTDDLLDHISQCSSKLIRLCLVSCHNITGSGLRHAVKRLPHLEKLHLFYTSISVEDIEVIGHSCPQLKSFKMNKEFRRRRIECDGDAFAIAKNMPELRHLQLLGNKMTNDGLQNILNGCPHLVSLDLRRCFNLDLGGNLGKLCMERIKDLKLPNDSTENCGFNRSIDDYDEVDDVSSSGDSSYDADDFNQGSWRE